MPEIVQAEIKTIATNPYRRLHAYPYIESKIDALQRSIAEVGLWPSVIARPLNDQLWKYELAFGHHRIEAARRSGLNAIPLIIEALTDRQMMQYMGRENLEDYNANFLIQLESWEAAIKSGIVFKNTINTQALDIARLLGWTSLHSDGVHDAMNATARACNAAYSLIEGGYRRDNELRDDGECLSQSRLQIAGTTGPKRTARNADGPRHRQRRRSRRRQFGRRSCRSGLR